MTMIMTNSDVSSSTSSPSPLIPNPDATLDDSSSPIASIEDKVVKSLALSSPNRDRDNHDSSISFGFSTSSSSADDESEDYPVGLEHDEFSNATQVKPESQILPLNYSGCNTNAIDDIDDGIWDAACSSELAENHHRWTPNVSPGYGSEDDDDDNSKMECSQPQPLSLGFKQMEPLKIEEPITGVGAGIWNLGNTCFLNSVLQCLTHTVPLVESLRSYKYQIPCNCGNDFCVIRALRYHIESALRPPRYPLAPDYFLNNLNYFSPDFHRYQQEDAHEFLQAFLDKLERCCLDRRTYRGYMSSPDVSIVEHVFGGRLVSGLRCCNCNSVSETFEKSVGISLEIEHVDTLWSALESFTSVEKLDEQLTCDNCKEKVSKEKQLLLDKLPLVAIFHLKRFKNNGFYMEKIFKHVKIPLELDLQPYMRDSQENGVCELAVSTKYYLYALVEHFGYSVAYGHYSSYVRSAPKIWHQFDDLQVTRIDEESVLAQDSYILFYVKEGTPWFSRAFEEMQPLLEASLRNSSPQSVLDSTNGECLSEISYEAVDKSNKPCDSAGVSNQNVNTEENFVSLSDELSEDLFLSAESSNEDSPMELLLDPLETEDSYNPCTEKEPDSCLAIERASTGDDFFPLLMVDPSPNQQVGTFQTLLKQLEETTKNEEGPCKQPLLVSDIADSKEAEFVQRDTPVKKPSPRARELKDQAVSTTTTGSPPKKIKTA